MTRAKPPAAHRGSVIRPVGWSVVRTSVESSPMKSAATAVESSTAAKSAAAASSATAASTSGSWHKHYLLNFFKIISYLFPFFNHTSYAKVAKTASILPN